MSGAKRQGVAKDALGPDAGPQAREAWLSDAAETVRRDGVIVLRDAIPRARIEAVAASARSDRMQGDDSDDRPFQPAPLRPRIPAPLDGPLADPAVFAPPSALAVARRLLGEEMIIGELGLVVSRPGEGAREPRRAAIPLFGRLDVESDVPAAAVTMLAPLGDIAPGSGFPEYWVGSHRSTSAAPDAAVSPFQPAYEPGCVVLYDWRTLYRAGPNSSGAAHMALYVSFQRKWLLSLSGSDYKSGLRVPAATLKTLPPAYHPLVAWALHQNKTDDVSEFAHLWLGRLVKGLQAVKGG